MRTARFRFAGLAALVLVALAAAAVSANSGHGGPGGHGAAGRGRVTAAELDFRNAMRQLWEDHITWTRMYIVSAVAGLPDQEAAAGRLLQNQADIGNAIKPFYGEAAGDQLTALLREHILIAAEAVAAAKAGDAAAFDDALARWYVNGDDIAAFLHGANPDAWPLDEMQAMMREHLDLTLEEASARLGGDWAADIAAYEEIHRQALEMADMLSLGIIHQFPKEFK